MTKTLQHSKALQLQTQARERVSPALLRLDPAYPQVWEDYETIRFGVDQVTARVVSPSLATQRMLNKLKYGVEVGALPEVGLALGLCLEEQHTLMAALQPVLTTTAHHQAYAKIPQPKHKVAVFGNEFSSTEIIETLSRRRFTAFSGTAISERGNYDSPLRKTAKPDVVVLVSRFVYPIELGQTHLRQGIPHLPVVFSDTGVRVGPFVSPEGNPCIMCAHLSELERDPALPRVAVQLLSQAPATEQPSTVDFIASFVALLLTRWSQQALPASEESWWVPCDKITPVSVPIVRYTPAHAACGCRLQHSVSNT